jgi:hypothetical protein
MMMRGFWSLELGNFGGLKLGNFGIFGVFGGLKWEIFEEFEIMKFYGFLRF